MPGRESRITRRNVIKSTGVAGTVGLAGCLGNGGGSPTDGGGGGAPTSLRAAAAPEGSMSYAVFTAFAEQLRDASAGARLNVTATSGTEVGIRLVGRGDAALTNSLGAAINDAYHERKTEYRNFSGDKAVQNKPLQALAFGYLAYWWQTYEGYGVDTLAPNNVEGKAVSTGPKGGTHVWATVLGTAGVTSDVAQFKNIQWSDAHSALKEKRVHVLPGYTVSGVTVAGWAKQVTSDSKVRVAKYTPDQVQAFKDSGVFFTTENDFSTYYDHDVGVQSQQIPGESYITVAGQHVGEDAVYDMVKSLFENSGSLQEAHVGLSQFSAQSSVDTMMTDVPIHPGAAKYYKEAGVWRDDFTVGELK